MSEYLKIFYKKLDDENESRIKKTLDAVRNRLINYPIRIVSDYRKQENTTPQHNGKIDQNEKRPRDNFQNN